MYVFFCLTMHQHFYSWLYYSYIAPSIHNFQTCLALEVFLNKTHQQFHLYAPQTKFTLQISTNGLVGVYGSLTDRNPSPITASIVMEGSNIRQYYISERSRPDLFLSLVSFGSTNASVLVTTEFSSDISVGELLHSLIN